MYQIDIEQLKHLYYHEKKSVFDVAKHFHVSVAVIENRMKKHGLPRRTASESQKLRYARRGLQLDINEIVRLYFDDHLSLAEVGKRLGVSGITIAKRLWKAGYQTRKRGGWRHAHGSRKGSYKFSESDFTEMKRLYCEQKMSSAEIAYQFGCSDITVRTHLKRLGVQIRTLKEAQTLRREKEMATAEGQHQKKVSEQIKHLPPLSPAQVTPAHVRQLRDEENLTIDAIALRCSLTNLEVYNILQGVAQ